MHASIVIAEDHVLFRSGLKQILALEEGLEVVGEAGDGLAAVQLVQEYKPTLILLDISMPELGGIEAIEHILQQSPATAILVISMHASPSHLRAALKAGAHGYLLKTADEGEFLVAIKAILDGHRYISSELANVMVDHFVSDTGTRPLSKLELLTRREREVLKLVAEGNTNKNIASKLSLSIKTVDSHRTNFMRKLGLRSAREVTLFALRHGLVEDK